MGEVVCFLFFFVWHRAGWKNVQWMYVCMYVVLFKIRVARLSWMEGISWEFKARRCSLIKACSVQTAIPEVFAPHILHWHITIRLATARVSKSQLVWNESFVRGFLQSSRLTSLPCHHLLQDFLCHYSLQACCGSSQASLLHRQISLYWTGDQHLRILRNAKALAIY